ELGKRRMIVVNLFAQLAESEDLVHRVSDPLNDTYIALAADLANECKAPVVFGWGNKGVGWEGVAVELLGNDRTWVMEWACKNKDVPHHPARLGYQPLKPWRK